jgi:hypothetical protein
MHYRHRKRGPGISTGENQMSVEPNVKGADEMVYVVISAGYWAEHESLKHALLHLFSMGKPQDHKLIFAYLASKDWDMDGMSIRAKKLIKVAEIKDKLFSDTLIERARAVADKVEDISDDILIAFEREQEAKAAANG